MKVIAQVIPPKEEEKKHQLIRFIILPDAMQDQFAKFHNSSLSTRGRIARPLENDPNLTSRDYYDLERAVSYTHLTLPTICSV